MSVTAEQQQFVADLVEKWKPRFFLEQYRIRLHFHDRQDKEEPSAAAMMVACNADMYHIATLHVYPLLFEEDRDIQEHDIVHELAHIPLEIFTDLIDRSRDGHVITRGEQERATERVTDWFANIILLSRKLDDPRIRLPD